MTYIIKQITEKGWILQKDADRIAILSELPSGKIQVLGKLEKKLFDKMSDIENYIGEEIKIEEIAEQSEELENIDGYPTKHLSIVKIDNINGLPVYKKGNVTFAAGYYGIKFENGWSSSFCPKLSTLESNEYIGPFNNKLEMQNSISQKKRTLNI